MSLATHASFRSGAIFCVGLAWTLGACSGTATGTSTPELVPCAKAGVQEESLTSGSKVDLLLVVDDSRSMLQEQAKLKTQLPRLVSVLVTGDREAGRPVGTPGLGVADFTPVKELRIGVLTPNLGVGTVPVPDCDATGDDGKLITRTGNPAPEGCGINGYGMGESFVDYIPGAAVGTSADFTAKVACVALTGDSGCGFEQQLEAPLKALTPAASSLRFQGDVPGNGEVNNFVRDDSVLAILLLTDEEDCSAATTQVFDQNSLALVAPANAINVRCARFADSLRPIDRYVNGFLALRNQTPSRLVFSVLAGIPFEHNEEALALDAMLALPAMAPGGVYAETLGIGDRPMLQPSCSAGADGTADPPRRIVQVAKGLGDAGAIVTVNSICAADYAPAFDNIMNAIGRALGGVCLPRAIDPGVCEVLETLPAGQKCEDLVDAGRAFVRKDGEQEVCRVAQLRATETGAAAPDGAGWYYEFDNSDTVATPATALQARCGAHAQRIAFTAGAEPESGSGTSLHCEVPEPVGDGTTPDVGGTCEADATCAKGGQSMGKTCPEDYALVCDPATLTWQIPCASDDDCAPSTCDTSGTRGQSGGPPAVCVIPICR